MRSSNLITDGWLGINTQAMASSSPSTQTAFLPAIDLGPESIQLDIV